MKMIIGNLCQGKQMGFIRMWFNHTDISYFRVSSSATWKLQITITYRLHYYDIDWISNCQCTYFRFLFRLSIPPIESKREASRVAGFLEARNADRRRYFAEVDIWKSNSSISAQTPNFLLLLFFFVSLFDSAAGEDWDETLNTSFREGAICGWRWENNRLFISSLGTTPKSCKGSQYFWNNGKKAVDNSSTLLVILQKGLSTTLFNEKENSSSLTKSHQVKDQECNIKIIQNCILTQEMMNKASGLLGFSWIFDEDHPQCNQENKQV